MTWHVITTIADQAPAVPLSQDAQHIEVRIDTPDRPEFRAPVVYQDLKHYQPNFSPVLLDLMHAAMAAYTADVRVPRNRAYDQWTREIHLHFSVSDVAPWLTASQTLTRLLAFLTGDHWTVSVHPMTGPYSPPLKQVKDPKQVRPQSVALFSGGLDSFIGALDLLATEPDAVLCGHYARGGGTSASQHDAINALNAHLGVEVPYVRYWVAPKGGGNRASEITTRGRSIIFLATGACTALALGATRLVVPENGFISINVPLTPARLGSFSTKTTHPYLIALFQQLLNELGLNLDISVPYRTKTKREVLEQCVDPAGVQTALAHTMSCAHPGASRYQTRKAVLHCGYCFPCLIRRAAMPVGDPTRYWINRTAEMTEKKGADLKAVKAMLARHAQKPVDKYDILKPGPVPRDQVPPLVAMYGRGLAELQELLALLR